MEKINTFRLFVLATIFICILGACSNKNIPSFTVIERGATTLYQDNGQLEHDLSAVAYTQKSSRNIQVFFGFDGGKNPREAHLRYTSLEKLKSSAKKIALPVIIPDIEAATQIEDTLYFMSSLSKPREDDECELISFPFIDDDALSVSLECIEVREHLLAFLAKNMDASWFERIKQRPAKQGGLNVEGLSSAKHEKYNIIFGLRSPLWDKRFAMTEDKDALALGQAILIFATISGGDIELKELRFLNLNGQGIRGMEYIVSLGGLMLISGTVAKGDKYQLWFYDLESSKLSQVETNDWQDLCRPESILDISERSELIVFSEHSGQACDMQRNSFLRLKYTR